MIPKSDEVFSQRIKITVHKVETGFNKSISKFLFKFTHHTKIWWEIYHKLTLFLGTNGKS